jgi:hypothetical protein
MGLPGKPDGIRGADVERYYREGRIREIADYCESDVVNTYRLWLRHELFRGKLTEMAFQASENDLAEFIKVDGFGFVGTIGVRVGFTERMPAMTTFQMGRDETANATTCFMA